MKVHAWAVPGGAGPFHIAVSQAIKNLRNMNLPGDRMAGKINGWSRTYVSGGGFQTSIARLIRGAPDEVTREFEQVRLAPDASQRAFIVTSSLSHRGVREALDGILAGARPDPYFVQLY